MKPRQPTTIVRCQCLTDELLRAASPLEALERDE
jgi:hypothetical protein